MVLFIYLFTEKEFPLPVSIIDYTPNGIVIYIPFVYLCIYSHLYTTTNPPPQWGANFLFIYLFINIGYESLLQVCMHGAPAVREVRGYVWEVMILHTRT